MRRPTALPAEPPRDDDRGATSGSGSGSGAPLPSPSCTESIICCTLMRRPAIGPVRAGYTEAGAARHGRLRSVLSACVAAFIFPNGLV
jgi:hypothetical protein